MKLIIKEYLASLKERNELDAVLPDLLSQIGLNVFSRPRRGTRQYGVDVGAVGALDDEVEKVYLFTIKAGDVSRKSWHDAPQGVKASLDEIRGAYIPNLLPTEHRNKEVVICLCCGGDVQEQTRQLWESYREQKKVDGLSFEEWNGDKLAALIQSNFLREDLLPEHARSRLRKALALIDEPEASYQHFATLIMSLSAMDSLNDEQRITAIRQMSICLWILFAWARRAENVESAYLGAEYTLLHAWEIVKGSLGKNTKAQADVEAAFSSIASTYVQICSEFLQANVLPYVEKLHAVSSAVRGSSSLDVNLKLFDLLGRLATNGLWTYWAALRCPDEENEAREAAFEEVRACSKSIRALVSNNPALLLPAKDDHAIDIFIAAWLLALDRANRAFITTWFAEIMGRSRFAYEAHLKYPSALLSYAELLEHPKSRDNDYRRDATQASILYPILALWAALLDDKSTYEQVFHMQAECLPHCTFQFWYPDDSSELHFYTNREAHGATLLGVTLSAAEGVFLTNAFGECDQSSQFGGLSAIQFGWWPLIVIACRHYRLPVPLHFVKHMHQPEACNGDTKTREGEAAQDA